VERRRLRSKSLVPVSGKLDCVGKKKIGAGSKLKLAAAGVVLAATAGGLYLKIGGVKVPAYEAVRVIDGDTFETREKQLTRLASVDALELEYCSGAEAKKALEKLVMGNLCTSKAVYRDGFHILISWVWAGPEPVNEKLVQEIVTTIIPDAASTTILMSNHI